MRLDLHIHSTASDGAVSPVEVVRRAVRGGLDVIALTDHDTIAGYRPAAKAAEALPLEVIPALEASSTLHGRELHFLGYFVDPDSAELCGHEDRAVRLRQNRIARMVHRLRGAGVQVEFTAVLEEAGPEGTSLGRPHLARALVSAGYATSVPDAFDRFIGDGHPAFLPTELLDPAEAIRLIAAAGGLPVWAHPPHDAVESLLPGLVEAGLGGLEVYRPRTPPPYVRRLERLALVHRLVLTGGSDWHSSEAGTELGDFQVSSDDIQPFLDAGGM